MRNLRNPDPKCASARSACSARRKYPEAVVPIAPLVNDPVDPIQLEAIATELSFFLVDEVPSESASACSSRCGIAAGRRRFRWAAGGLAAGRAAELIEALLKAVDDENARVRIEAIYAIGARQQERR